MNDNMPSSEMLGVSSSLTFSHILNPSGIIKDLNQDSQKLPTSGISSEIIGKGEKFFGESSSLYFNLGGGQSKQA